MSQKLLMADDGRKICRGCRLPKTIDEFFKTSKSPDGHRARCKSCIEEQNEAWRKANPEKHKTIYRRTNHRSNLKKRFGISEEQFAALWAMCDGCCGICKGPETRQRRLSLDHDHAIGELRGFVCSRCNLLLGNAGDDPELLDKAATYLRHPPLRTRALAFERLKVVIHRSGYDPKLGKNHPNNFDPTLEPESPT